MKTPSSVKPMPELKLSRLPKGRSGRAASGLTSKQEAFCQHVASGCNLSDAYRRSFCCNNAMGRTINVKASALAARGDIRARIDTLKLQNDRVEECLNARNRETWFKRAWAEADPDDLSTTTPSSRVGALKLLGAALCIADDRLEPKPKQTSKEVGQQIMAKLISIKTGHTHDDECI